MLFSTPNQLLDSLSKVEVLSEASIEEYPGGNVLTGNTARVMEKRLIVPGERRGRVRG